MSLFNKNNFYKYITLILGMILIFITSVWFDFSLFISVFLFIGFISLFFVQKYPLEILLTFLIIRPTIDTIGTNPIFKNANFLVNYNAIIAILLIIISGIIFLNKLEKLRKIPGFWIGIAFLCIGVLSFFWSANFFSSISELIRISSIFFMYFVAFLLIDNKKKFKKLNIAIICSAIIPIIIALVQYILGTGETVFGEFFTRTTGTFFYPNSLAFFLVFIIGILVTNISSAKKNIIKFNYVFLLGLSFLALLSTYTRGAWFGAIIILGIYTLIKYKKIFLFGGIIIFIIYLFVPIIQERINDIIRLEPFSSLVWRFRLWGDMLNVFIKRPIFGYGLGTFQTLSANNQGLNMLPVPEAHNDYLKVMVELGVIGLITYLAFIFRILIFNLKTFFKTKDKLLKDMTLISTIVLGVFILMAFGDNVLRGTAVQWTLFAYLGGVAGVTRKINKSKK